MKRQVYRVLPPLRGARFGWRVRTPGGGVQTCTTKRVAVSMARRWARAAWEDKGRLTQLVIHGRDGKIQTEHTYGADPKRFVG